MSEADDLALSLVRGDALSRSGSRQVYFDANRAVAAAFGEAGFAAPATVIATRAS